MWIIRIHLQIAGGGNLFKLCIGAKIAKNSVLYQRQAKSDPQAGLGLWQIHFPVTSAHVTAAVFMETPAAVAPKQRKAKVSIETGLSSAGRSFSWAGSCSAPKILQL